jgi:hypothetical protein
MVNNRINVLFFLSHPVGSTAGMPRPLIPPRGVFVASHLLFDERLTPTVRDTLVQIMALAWSSPDHCTPPLALDTLARLTHKSPRRLKGHIAVLRNNLAALRLQHAGDGQVVYVLADWLFADKNKPCKPLQPPCRAENAWEIRNPRSGPPTKAGQAAGNEKPSYPHQEDALMACLSAVKGRAHLPNPARGNDKKLSLTDEEEAIKPPLDSVAGVARLPNPPRGYDKNLSLTDEEEAIKSPLDSVPGVAHLPNPAWENDKNLSPPVKEEELKTPINSINDSVLLLNVKQGGNKKLQPLSQDLRIALLEAGVFPRLLDEVARSGQSEPVLFALLTWARADQPACPAPLFMARLRAGAKPPGRFFGEACAMCGQTGGHTPDCRRRYLDDPYAGLVEH